MASSITSSPADTSQSSVGEGDGGRGGGGPDAGDAMRVAAHYNQLPSHTRSSRQHSKILYLRNFNNWVKAVLINLYVKKGAFVLDLCCGRGGDLQKWSIANIQYLCGADISANSVREAVDRYNKMVGQGRASFPSHWIIANCHTAKLEQYLPPPLYFNTVSCQFSLHYAFESEEKASGLIRNAAARLAHGGYFIGTTLDALEIVKRVRGCEGRQEMRNEVFSLRFDHALPESGPLEPYGVRYSFSLEEAVQVCPEYLVHPRILFSLAEKHGLELVEMDNLHAFAARHCSTPEFRQLLHRMKGPSAAAPMSQAEWEVIGLYMTFVFKKVRASPPNQHMPPRAAFVPHDAVVDALEG